MFRYALSIFVGAFLLFQVQPLISKVILPWFGGGPAVWTTCMLFFQLLLLGGYAYAHLLVSTLSPSMQGRLHLGLLALSLLALPIMPSDAWRPVAGGSPTLQIMALLGVCVGAPYLLLCATGPLLQSWFSRTHADRSPYKLYALSNVGSMLALVSYPFLVEPMLRLRSQTQMWSWSYVCFVICCGWCAIQLVRGSDGSQRVSGSSDAGVRPARWSEQLLWVALAACGSVMLLATTNQLCQDVAVVPLLWVLPLALYLLTFVICFGSELLYLRPIYLVALALVLWLTCKMLVRGVIAPIRSQVLVYSLNLLVCCMVCHGELYRRRPHARHLTQFYLMVAAGGALGGLLVTLVAPAVLSGYLEFHLGLVATVVLLLVCMFFDERSWMHWAQCWAERRRYRLAWWASWLLLLGLTVGLCRSLTAHASTQRGSVVESSRNFYGVLRVEEYYEGTQEHQYSLTHGRIRHGFQFRSKQPPTKELRFASYDRPRWPTSYYCKTSGVGLALLHHPGAGLRVGLPREKGDKRVERPRPLRVGLIGLGTGSLAAYGRKGDVYRFYEINPEVVRLARKWFSYLKDCPADWKVILGDARIEMERQKSQQFDVLAVDAFSSDAIPVHLLTRESFALYWRHLKPDGVLAVHISNRYLDLGPVLRGLAQDAGCVALRVEDTEEQGKAFGGLGSEWVLVCKKGNKRFREQPTILLSVEPWPEGMGRIIWTDDYSNLFQVLTKSEDEQKEES